MKTCSCTVLMKEVSDMCLQCKLDYIEWATGLTRKDVIWLARTATVGERVKKLRNAKEEQERLRRPRPQLRLVKRSISNG